MVHKNHHGKGIPTIEQKDYLFCPDVEAIASCLADFLLFCQYCEPPGLLFPLRAVYTVSRDTLYFCCN